MTELQKQNIQPVIEGFYANGTEKQHAQYREIAAHVYANALRDPDISIIELKTQFSLLQNIASSASFTENSTVLGRAIIQPFSDGAEVLQDGRTLTATVAHVIKLADDPLANIKGVWNSAQNTANAAYQLAQHATGMLTMEERQRLATLYDLPHAQRLQALHTAALKDTAAMVSVGSLPGIFPDAMIKAKLVANDASASVLNEVNQLPKLNGPSSLPVLAGVNSEAENVADELPQVLSMANDGPDNGGGTANEQKFNIKDHELPDPDFDSERVWYHEYRNHYMKDLSERMVALGLKQETGQFKQQLDYMLDVRVVSNAVEYNAVLQNAQKLIGKAQNIAFSNAISAVSSAEDAGAASHYFTTEFNMLMRYVDYERDKQFVDLVKDESKFALQEQARRNPDSVGYDRSVSPRPITERELHHHLYLTKLHESVADLKVVLELVGLKDHAKSVNAQVDAMRLVRLEDSKAEYQQQVKSFMEIEYAVKNAEFKAPTVGNISERYFKGIQEKIGDDLAHIRDEIEHDREYHIRHQLWQRQYGDERRASEMYQVAQKREALFGSQNTLETQPPDLEP